jgi:hypothetical protein
MRDDVGSIVLSNAGGSLIRLGGGGIEPLFASERDDNGVVRRDDGVARVR